MATLRSHGPLRPIGWHHGRLACHRRQASTARPVGVPWVCPGPMRERFCWTGFSGQASRAQVTSLRLGHARSLAVASAAGQSGALPRWVGGQPRAGSEPDRAEQAPVTRCPKAGLGAVMPIRGAALALSVAAHPSRLTTRLLLAMAAAAETSRRCPPYEGGGSVGRRRAGFESEARGPGDAAMPGSASRARTTAGGRSLGRCSGCMATQAGGRFGAAGSACAESPLLFIPPAVVTLGQPGRRLPEPAHPALSQPAGRLHALAAPCHAPRW
jgi:hypothetical protein